MNLSTIMKLGLDRDIADPLDFPKGWTLNIGAGNKKVDCTHVLDFPLWNAGSDPIPFSSGYFSGIHCYHFLEHLENPVKVLLEMQRVLETGGVANILVPYYNSQMQHQDLDHRSSFCEETWKTLFSNPYYNKYNIKWKFRIHTNIIIGLKERNLSLFTQLVKEEG